MRTKRVLRYYCDHCSKGGCGKSAMVRHEKRCIKNPQRECGFCQDLGVTPIPLEKRLEEFEDHGDVTRLEKFVNHCPACTLQTIIHYRKLYNRSDDPVWVEWSYKDAVAAFWEEKRASEESTIPYVAPLF